MKIEYFPDGTKLIKHSPIEDVPFYSDWLQILLDRGAAHEVTEIDRKKESRTFGKPITKIVTLDRNQEQRAIITEDGDVGICCIGCGGLIVGEVHNAIKTVSQVKLTRGGRLKKILGENIKVLILDKITIGGYIQVTDEQQTDHKEITRKWRRQPVFKSGIGCSACKEQFAAIVAQTNNDNRIREQVAVLMAKQHAPSTGIDPATARTPCTKHRMPFCAACLDIKGIRPAKATVKLPNQLVAYIDVFARDAMGNITE
jgi:hypothetical protein